MCAIEAKIAVGKICKAVTIYIYILKGSERVFELDVVAAKGVQALVGSPTHVLLLCKLLSRRVNTNFKLMYVSENK